MFRYQAYLGLRVEEVSKLHISNINFDKRELIIKSEKSAVSDSLVIPSDLFNETIDFINKNIASIKASSGYIFFKENDNNSNKVLYIDMNYVRKVFRQIAKATELNQVYDYSEETSAP